MGQALCVAPFASAPSCVSKEYDSTLWTSIDLKVAIDEANSTCAGLAKKGKQRVKFRMEGGDDATALPKSGLFWRAAVTIRPSRQCDGGEEEASARLLSLPEFARTYQFIKDTCNPSRRPSAPSAPSSAASSGRSSVSTECTDKCGVCYERKPDTVLACMHAFCESCVSEWSHVDATCPLCRNAISDESECFVDVAYPSREDLNAYLISSFFD
ncbi:hypothetical protein PTSG_01176 [Salpingoeca rosetta]|uniref:RING-type domain-containing protein n=1 Tax=Salpingoeca rosetta (strain ATCC 50818 / BSB-021) TaxID=946362 RepID=F2U110_SALR5|nr:uncharacterized protein PTSG_01176 [Salpingoeca rosetta]EGD80584.1 hypothetical protein PTSG_01176 [Salpingoeca rosetta]|eukprot:XP_004997145.1 hypothetical protein PTSG_01176 [Salpingoeca rosetta]